MTLALALLAYIAINAIAVALVAHDPKD